MTKMSSCSVMASPASATWKASDESRPESIWPKRSLAGTRTSNAMHRCVSSPISLASIKQCEIPNSDVCIVDAKQIEVDFASLTSQPFLVRIVAPTGETSPLLNFPAYGKTEFFSPRESGCGHGSWKFEVLQEKDNNKLEKINEETMYLDGVGSLFFTVGDDMRPRLSSQEFLRLPSASNSCKRVHNNTC